MSFEEYDFDDSEVELVSSVAVPDQTLAAVPKPNVLQQLLRLPVRAALLPYNVMERAAGLDVHPTWSGAFDCFCGGRDSDAYDRVAFLIAQAVSLLTLPGTATVALVRWLYLHRDVIFGPGDL